MKTEQTKLPLFHHSIGETVYLITDLEQLPRIVTGIIIRPSDHMYLLSSGIEETRHYEIEITKQKQIV